MHAPIYPFLLLIACSLLVSASTLADLPACALPCAEKNVDATGCGTDVDCLCGQHDFQVALADCIKSSCSEDNQCDFASWSNKACPNVDVTNAPLRCRAGFVHGSATSGTGTAATATGVAAASSATGSDNGANGIGSSFSNTANTTSSPSSAAAAGGSQSQSSGSTTSTAAVSKSKAPIGAIVGGVVGGIAVIGILILGVLCLLRRRKAEAEPGYNGKAELDAGNTPSAGIAATEYKPQAELGAHEAEKPMVEAPGNDISDKKGLPAGGGSEKVHGASELYTEQGYRHGASETYTEHVARHELP